MSILSLFRTEKVDVTTKIEYVKWLTKIQTSHQKFPKKAAKRLKEILLDDQISVDDFELEFNKIMASTKTFRWRWFLYIDHHKNQLLGKVSQISIYQVFIFIGIVSFNFYLYKKYIAKYPKRKKRLKRIYKLITNLISRVFAVSAYLFPIITLYQRFIHVLLPKYPVLLSVYPDFLKWCVDFTNHHTNVVTYIYFFGIINIIRPRLLFGLRNPLSRFTRFNLARGLIIYCLMSVPDAIFGIFITAQGLSHAQRVGPALIFFTVYSSWLLPGMFNALTYTYPKSKFLREAIEVHLGRDIDPGFKWWDRDY